MATERGVENESVVCSIYKGILFKCKENWLAVKRRMKKTFKNYLRRDEPHSER